MNFDLCGLPQHKPRTRQRRGQFARCLAAIAVCASAVASNAAEPLMTRPDWSTYFVALKATGTMVVRDERSKPAHTLAYNMDRANQRFSPASTFKIPHAAFALEAGLVRDEFQVFKWDGTKRSYEAWNADQDLRSSMRNSVVWVYQGFARDIGESRAKAYLESVGYGNANPSGGKDGYWIDGNLRISALEQVAFLQRPYLRVPIGVAIGVVFLDESLTSTAWIGLLCVIAGVVAMTIPASKPKG